MQKQTYWLKLMKTFKTAHVRGKGEIKIFDISSKSLNDALQH